MADLFYGKLSKFLRLSRCPHCGIAKPALALVHEFGSESDDDDDKRYWHVHVCGTCGGVVTAGAYILDGNLMPIHVVIPSNRSIDEAIPEAAREYLRQASESLHAPAGAIMLAASAVDAMLKAKELKDGALYERINLAKKEQLITESMADWAHEVRLDSNDQRHADEDVGLPSQADAKRALEFADALGEFMFVLPSRVKRGLRAAKDGDAGE